MAWRDVRHMPTRQLKALVAEWLGYVPVGAELERMVREMSESDATEVPANFEICLHPRYIGHQPKGCRGE